ncbi:MAG: hypothetical protein ACWA6X_00855 [Bauldia sp.]
MNAARNIHRRGFKSGATARLIIPSGRWSKTSGVGMDGRRGPLRQGDLDSLCGVYALVNAVRKSAHEHGLGDREAKELFDLLIDARHEKQKVAESVTLGIFSGALWRLARKAVAYCRSRSIPMAASRPIGREYWPGLDLPMWLAIQAARPATAVVMGLVLPWDHWTVLHSVGRRYVSFYDSSTCRRLALSRFADTAGGDRAITNPRSLIVFEVDELAFGTDD